MIFMIIVVYLLIPTSNHNYNIQPQEVEKLYIFWFLHQTTTGKPPCWKLVCCISFDSYIKPQQAVHPVGNWYVVYLLIPTSNHNWLSVSIELFRLYIFWFLHQTTTGSAGIAESAPLYIFWFLHQTTTDFYDKIINARCISFDSYIKPQQHKVVRNCC